MSARDAVGRRRFAIETLKRNMELADEGWSLYKMVRLLLREYGHGITAKRAADIIKQLTVYHELYEVDNKWYRKKPEKQTQ